MASGVLSLLIVMAGSTVAIADEADAERILKSMSDYIAAQQDLVL